ncbi:MAG: hypothetical protein I8H77_00895 [Comamonadaceae bacterium]|nr:hypothetical protein [Comamonadaceae bacterium]
MKKGRAKEVTRPQPTIYGNCDSWSFIVGKKRLFRSLKSRIIGRCDAATEIYQQLINSSGGLPFGQAVVFLWNACNVMKPISAMWI